MANENQLFSLEDIFTKCIFRIPDYQRGYAWEKNQLIDFWEDIINLPDDLNHYTGMLSLDRVPKEDYSSWTGESWIFEKDYVAYYIVDGQQRLTTFVILVQSFVDFIRSLDEYSEKADRDIYIGDETLDRTIERFLYVVNRKYPTLVAFKFGYCDAPSYNYLKKVIMNKDIVCDIAHSLRQFLNLRYWFFRKCFSYHFNYFFI